LTRSWNCCSAGGSGISERFAQRRTVNRYASATENCSPSRYGCLANVAATRSSRFSKSSRGTGSGVLRNSALKFLWISLAMNTSHSCILYRSIVPGLGATFSPPFWSARYITIEAPSVSNVPSSSCSAGTYDFGLSWL